MQSKFPLRCCLSDSGCGGHYGRCHGWCFVACRGLAFFAAIMLRYHTSNQESPAFLPGTLTAYPGRRSKAFLPLTQKRNLV